MPYTITSYRRTPALCMPIHTANKSRDGHRLFQDSMCLERLFHYGDVLSVCHWSRCSWLLYYCWGLPRTWGYIVCYENRLVASIILQNHFSVGHPCIEFMQSQYFPPDLTAWSNIFPNFPYLKSYVALNPWTDVQSNFYPILTCWRILACGVAANNAYHLSKSKPNPF